ncbi:LamG-like jellyroll fold domain-containing protein [Geojedonia litorea]|uniref:LamG-like jellyroll fold domain-containing protein n=1 Tax=Geojedonia litorea TaxID=1268269 RepID=A0ABV9N815_9FLAO
MKPTLRFAIALICLFWTSITNSQTCNGSTFLPPATPSNCAYTYTGTGPTGWQNAAGNDIAGPPILGSGVNITANVCILANLNYNFASFKDNTFYVAPGVTFTGNASAIKCTLIIEGTAVFSSTPGTGGTKVYIYPSGSLTLPDTFSVSSNDVVHNAGTLNIGVVNASPIPNVVADLNVSSTFWSYSDSLTVVTGDGNISGTYNNCGLFEVYGDIQTQGSSNFNNDCATYLHGTMKVTGDYTNMGLMYFEGNVELTGPTVFYNAGTMVFYDLVLTNDDIVGIGDRAVIIARNTATLSNRATITNSYFYNSSASPPAGGGFNSVCSNCSLTDVNILIQAIVPNTVEEVLANCGSGVIIDGPHPLATLDFDGVDDYLTTTKFINGLSKVSIMGWVKSDTGNSTNMTIAGEDTGCKLWLQNGNKPALTIKASGVAEKTIYAPSVIKLNEWHHLTGTYDSTTGTLQLFIDGVLVSTGSVGATGNVIANTASSNNSFEIGRRSSNVTNKEYFKGDIDEVRVFNTVVTNDQLRRMVYQEIKSNNGLVRGKIIDKDIVDISSNATIPWSNLLAYYPMTDIISYSRTTDFSSNNRKTYLKNITSIQEQTAPIPYQTKADGAWTTEGTWLHGDVWDIEDVANNKDWSIVQIKNNVTTSNTSKTIGLIIDSNKTLTVNGDNLIQNSWYLELNGTLDLKNDSQLIQTINSDLVTSASGKIMRRQEGAASFYWYNYWGSPVGATGITTLTNNNSASNNANNAKFKTNMLKDHVPAAMQFSSAYNALGKLSTRWMYKFQSGVTYYDWAHVNPNAEIAPGVGYIHKGTGTSNPSQQYVFEGKPNNGTILINVTDKGGPGSAPNTTYTTSLFGNPYPSAIDIHKFIDDNQGVIGGSIQLWQQWSGATHNLYEYDGGYAVVNKLGGVRAYQFVGMEGATNGSQDGTKTPTRYLPVAQGFVVEIVADGVVEFNNDQRVFIKEADADGSYENGSSFFRTNGSGKGKGNEKDKGNGSGNGNGANTSNRMKKLRIELKSVTGSPTRRELLLGFSDETTDGFDYGYDAVNTEVYNSDLNLALEGENYTMLAFAPITDDKVIPLNFKSSEAKNFEIKITEYDNIDPNQKIFLKDNLTGTYANLKGSKAYQFSSEAGDFNNRFEIVFQPEQQSLSTEESGYQFNLIFYNSTTKNLHVKGLDSNVDKLYVINMQGQNVREFFDLQPETLSRGLPISGLSTGVYIVYFKSDNATKTKKIIID